LKRNICMPLNLFSRICYGNGRLDDSWGSVRL
ncbi:MAG: hypothetical protein ACI9XC_002683, partial [Gammaproteobacteria bacterium]